MAHSLLFGGTWRLAISIHLIQATVQLEESVALVKVNYEARGLGRRRHQTQGVGSGTLARQMQFPFLSWPLPQTSSLLGTDPRTLRMLNK